MARKTISEAADLLSCLASQIDDDSFTTSTIVGRWSRRARSIAENEWDAVADEIGYYLDWREHYAEAEARLRSMP